MRKLLFLSGLALWIFSCNGKDNGSGQSPATDTMVNVTNSTPNNATGTGASNMGGDTGTINGTPNNQTMTNSGSTGGNNMNSSGTTTTNRSDTSMNHGTKKGSQHQ